MDDDFRILFDYVEQMKRELAEKDKADLQTKSAEDEEKKCVHESIETEEAYVCRKLVSCSRTSSNPTFIGAIMRWSAA